MKTLLLLSMLLATPTPEDWAASFPGPLVGSQLELERGGYLVAPVGETAHAAATALEAGLRSSNRAQLVMDAGTLGDLTGLDDRQIVERCRGLPIERVATVRVFAVEGGPTQAVVALYALDGTRKAAFAAEAGKPLAARPEPAPAAAAQKSAKDLYDERYIGFADVQIFQGSDMTNVMRRWITPFQGKYRHPLEGVRFFEVAGREDLVAAYHHRNRVRLGIGLGGVGVMLGGGGLITWGLTGACTKRDVVKDQCLSRDATPLIAGGITAGVGLVAVLVAAVIDPNPVDAPAAREIADQYNRKLRRELGLEEARREGPPAPLAAMDLSIVF